MLWFWIAFILFILFCLALDLGLLQRKAHEVSVKEALTWSAIWITLALLFTVFIYFGYENHWLGLGKAPEGAAYLDKDSVSAANPKGELSGSAAALKYVTGYIVELSLSVDNLFVIALIFGTMGIPKLYQHRVLFWGILGALVMRGAMIGLGTLLIAKFAWIIYVFGAFLIFTGIKMLVSKDGHTGDPSNNFLNRTLRRFFPLSDGVHGQHFFVRAGDPAAEEAKTPDAAPKQDDAVKAAKPGAWMMTPLAVALVAVEVTDLVFAVDSIPAILAITTDSFLVFTSNVFAILGLRSLFFALSGLLDRFHLLKIALSIVLVVIGIKMIFHDWLKEWFGEAYNYYTLGVVLFLLAGGVIASLLIPNKKAAEVAANDKAHQPA